MHAPASSDRPGPVPPRRYRRFMRIVAWFYAGSTILVLLLVAMTAILLNSTRFHNYVIQTAEQQAQESLGVRVQLQNFALNLSNLRLDVYGVTVDGASPYSNPPLLQVRHAEARVRIISILHKKWYLDDIRVDQPVVQVFVDKDGHSNIPTIKSSNSGNTSVFDLGIRHAVLDRGEFFYNDRPPPLAADPHNFDFHSVFNEALKQYVGKLAYADGHLTFGAFQPFTHNLEAQFDATPTTFHLSTAKISGGAAQIVLSAAANDYSTNPAVQTQYDVTADGVQLARLLNNPSVPAGMVRATGSAQYQSIPGQPALQALVINGDMNSRQLLVKTG
jgi:uncharacterized protein involved in outer membrane biogenesis